MDRMKKDMKAILRTLFKHPYYLDIVVLLFFLESHYERVYVKSQKKWVLQYGNYGLEQKHFRYILMKQHGLDKLSTSQMGQFEKDNKIAVEWFTDSWSKGSIASQKDLNHYLKYLTSHEVIKNIKKKKPYRYVLFSDFRETYELMKIEDNINSWGNNYIEILSPYPKKDKGFLFGLDFNIFTKNESEEIGKYLTAVQENLGKIIELNNKKRNNKEKISIGFFYHSET